VVELLNFTFGCIMGLKAGEIRFKKNILGAKAMQQDVVRVLEEAKREVERIIIGE
jgi:hypothetical protein